MKILNESEPKANCQRVVLSVLPSVDGEHTVIGDVKKEKLFHLMMRFELAKET